MSGIERIHARLARLEHELGALKREFAALHHGAAAAAPTANLTIRQRRFIEAFAKVGDVVGAAREARASRRTHYHWLKCSPAYAAAFDGVRFGPLAAADRPAPLHLDRKATVGTSGDK